MKIKSSFQVYYSPLIFSTLEKCILTHCFCICSFPRQFHTVEIIPFPEATKPERHFLAGKEVISAVFFSYFLKTFLIVETFFSTVKKFTSDSYKIDTLGHKIAYIPCYADITPCLPSAYELIHIRETFISAEKNCILFISLNVLLS